MYKVYLNGIEATAANVGALKITAEPFTDSGAYDFRYNVAEPLIFSGDEYATIKSATDADQCAPLLLRIDEECEAGTSVIYSGIFTRANCRFFTDTCRVEVEPETNDRFYCLLKNYRKELNILATPGVQSVDYIPAFGLEFGSEPCVDGTNINEWGGAPFVAALGLYARVVAYNTCLAGAPVEPPPSNSPWFLLEDNCATNGTAKWGRRAIAGVDVTTGVLIDETECDALLDPFCVPPLPALPGNWFNACTYTDGALPPKNKTVWVDFSGDVSSVSINNGRFLDVVIAWLLNEYDCGLLFSSDLLQNPINPVTGAPNPNPSTLIFQKSDVTIAEASQPARSGFLSLADLLENISTLFNGRWFIDSNTLKFEHISDVKLPTVGLDLTTYAAGKYVEYKNTFDFEKAEQPAAENWKNATLNQNIDFIGLPITYDATCTSGETREYTTQRIEVELPRLFQNEQAGLEGFVLINGNAINYADTYSEAGELTGQFVPNAPLCYANLARDYYTFDRPLPSGNLNGTATVFDSTKETKRQISVKFPYCCFTDINPRELVRTELGDGRILKMEYNLKNKTVVLDLIFEI